MMGRYRLLLVLVRPPPYNIFKSNLNSLHRNPEHLLWTLLETFAYLDYMALAEMNCDDSLRHFDPVPWMAYRSDDVGRGVGEGPGDLSFCERHLLMVGEKGMMISYLFYSVLTESGIDDRAFVKGWTTQVKAVIPCCSSFSLPSFLNERLFHFRYGDAASTTTSPNDPAPTPPPADTQNQETFIVKVTVSTSPSTSFSLTPSTDPNPSEIRHPPPPNDLISQLSSQLSQSNQKVIFDPSEVVAFQLVSGGGSGSGGGGLPGYSSSSSYLGTWGSGRKKFKYPKYLYLDQFLQENAELASEKRRAQREMGEEVQRLGLKRSGLVGFKVCS
jgi:hypothetical protein